MLPGADSSDSSVHGDSLCTYNAELRTLMATSKEILAKHDRTSECPLCQVLKCSKKLHDENVQSIRKHKNLNWAVTVLQNLRT